MTKKFNVPRGTSDILPDEIALWQIVEAKARETLSSFNYQEIRTPIFEETELFARSMGQTSDVVMKQMLNLASQRPDENGNPKLSGLALRPENTASVVRSYIQNSLDRKESLSKLFYIGPMFRGERPQKGRLRQFHQIGVEAIGLESCSSYLDAEIISLSVEILRSLGLKNFCLKLNTLGTPEDKKNFSQILKKQLKEKTKSLCPDCQERIDRNVFRVLDCKVKECRKIVAELKVEHSYLSNESQQYFSAVKSALDSLGISYEVDCNLVRGLDYYTHTVFEISDSSLGAQDALGAGGRYNNLVAQLGGAEVDAVGFALGIERILLAIPAQQKEEQASLNSFIIALDESIMPKAFQILDGLRKRAVSCDISYRGGSMKSQMRQANKLNAKTVIILGSNEIANEVVTLKDMASGQQEEVPIKKDSLDLLTKKVLERCK